MITSPLLRRTLLSIVLACIFSATPATIVIAQNQQSQDYIIGTQLLRQGNFERAAEVFESLVKSNPGNYMNLEGYLLALTNLKEYEKAIDALKAYLLAVPNDINSVAKLGELYHISGDTTTAYTMWDNALSIDTTNPNVDRVVAESMQQRREFDKAANTLQTARKRLNEPNLFLFELANIYLISGKYDAAAREYNSILLQYPERLQFIQRQYSRFNDQELVDAAIVESDESIKSLPRGDERIGMLREFQLWLLLERGLYRRAIATARGIDMENGQQSMALFNVAQRLAGQNEFELSEQALISYAENKDHPISARSSEELAAVYMRWARWLITNNLDTGEKIEELYQKADATLKSLRASFPGYQRRSQVVLLQTELALDYLKDGDLARSYFNDMQRFGEADQFKIEQLYLEGRLLIFEGKFNEARVSLTRANTESRIGELAEKTRYFLALTDFYSRDYEFAGIQLKALERQNASLYANDALQLRLWIMEGKNKDSTTTQIDLFSEAMYGWMKNDLISVYDKSMALINEHTKHALADDALLLLSRAMRYEDPVDALAMIHQHISTARGNSLTEQLLWERVLLALRLKKDPQRVELELRENLSQSVAQDSTTLTVVINTDGTNVPIKSIIQDRTAALELLTDPGLIQILEDLLVRFPQGFYSSAAREQLRNLKQTS